MNKSPSTPKTATRRLRGAIALAAVLLALPAVAQITFYEHDGYRGRAASASGGVPDFRGIGMNDRASSVVVEGGRWEVCENTQFGGNCRLLRPGNYPSLTDLGLNDRISSARPANRRRGDVVEMQQPSPEPAYAWRRRPQERLFEAEVTSVRAVVGAPTERCWIERQEATQRESASTSRTLLGAVIGGVIGHQIGSGTGRDVATVGGAIAGGAVGANTGRGEATAAHDVRRCSSVASTTPAYWDVGYRFRGVQHQMQMQTEPGRTVPVNAAGEPRL